MLRDKNEALALSPAFDGFTTSENNLWADGRRKEKRENWNCSNFLSEIVLRSRCESCSRVDGEITERKHFYLQSCTFVDQFVQAALKRTLSVSIKSINTPAEQHKTDESAGDTSTQHKLF